MARKVEARSKARQATAALLKERRERERKITEAATAYFQVSEERDELRAELDRAESRIVEAAADLCDLGLSTSEVIDMLGIEPSLARSAHRLAKQRAKQNNNAPDPQENPEAPINVSDDATSIH